MTTPITNTTPEIEEAFAAYEKNHKCIPPILNFYSDKARPFGIFSNFFPAPFVVGGFVAPGGDPSKPTTMEVFKTTEAYFQAVKFLHPAKGTVHGMSPDGDTTFAEIKVCASCFDVTKIGRDRSRPMRPDWAEVKFAVMQDAVTCKFLCHPKLLTILLATAVVNAEAAKPENAAAALDKWHADAARDGGAILVEHTKNDSVWGDGGGDGSTGTNWLGIVLMKVRQQLAPLKEEQRAAVLKQIVETGVNPLRMAEKEKKTAGAAAAAQ